MTLEALGHALKRMKKSSSIRVFSGNSYLLGAIGKGWMEEWAKNGWRNAAGRPVKNVDLWQKIYDFSREQKLDVEENREHPYHSWQLTQLKRLEKVDFTLWEEGFDKPGGPFEVNDIRTVAI